MPTAIIRAKIAGGGLPTSHPEGTWAGYGSGRLCDGCDRPIVRHDVEWGAELPGGRTCHFHTQCLAVWNEERARVLGP